MKCDTRWLREQLNPRAASQSTLRCQERPTIGTVVSAVSTTIQAVRVARAAGVAYERINPETEGRYIGQAKSPGRYAGRQTEHNQANGIQYKYKIIGKAKPGNALDKLEQDLIRQGGGPSTKGGPLENKRYQMNGSVIGQQAAR